MKCSLGLVGVLLGLFMPALALPSLAGAKKLPRPLVTGLKNPASVAIGLDGRIYISEIGAFDRDGDGRVLVIDKEGKAVPFASGLDDPRGMVAWQTFLFVVDKQRIWKIDAKGKAVVFAAASAFPSPPLFLNDIAVDELGTLYVSDAGDLKGSGGALYRIDPKGKVALVTDARRNPHLKIPQGLVLDGKSFLLMVDAGSGELLRIKGADGHSTPIASGFGAGAGLAWDYQGRLYVTDGKNGRLFVIPRPGAAPVLCASGFQEAADLCLDAAGKFLLVPDRKAGTVTALPIGVPGEDVDESPLPLSTEAAFPHLHWTGWKGEKDDGKNYPLRPILLTHAGDGSNRIFVGIQQGIIHVFPNDPGADRTQIFLDLSHKVHYNDKENEQGLLGLAFHPRFKTSGEFFVFYTPRHLKMTNVLVRFRVRKDDPGRADPDSEQELLRITRPFWNHDGGTICFGPDGHLYIAVGDGGSADDPFKNGQNFRTLLGKVLRIDVDRRDPGKNYAIPPDNPFVGRKDALPEIWAYGLRNIWRMAFDRKTGKLWASDVGQNLYEEIDIIVKGGNYGWSLREGLHPFSPQGVDANPDMIDPIWEYHHAVGKSLTGGLVYRGKRLPELEGAYVYGDYITCKLWALTYDEARKRVRANRPIRDPNLAIFSFGEDETGEIYFLTTSLSGRSILQFVRSAPDQKPGSK